MYIWLLISIVSVGLLFVMAILYSLHFHLLLRRTIKYPKLNKLLGSPKGIYDYSQRQNVECYEAINDFFASYKYLNIRDSKLRAGFKTHLKLRQKAKLLGYVIVTNMIVFLCAFKLM